MKKSLILLEIVKFEHTIFALPFAFLGAFLAAQGLPELSVLIWIVLAMVGGRSAAMAFNRQVDRVFDGLNPRTSNRALPSGLISPHLVTIFILSSSALFFFSAWMLNKLAFHLSPIALATVFFYSYTKRFTTLSHLLLGLSLAMAPVGGWIAVSGTFNPTSLWIGAAVLFWVGGFDIIYSCLDSEFDRDVGLHSMPSRLGIKTSLEISVLSHILMVLLLSYGFWELELSLMSWVGLVIVSLGLTYEHTLISAEDLSRIDTAFFTINGLISTVLFTFVALDLCLMS